VQVVDGEQRRRQDLFDHDEVAHVGPAEVRARATPARISFDISIACKYNSFIGDCSEEVKQQILTLRPIP
jgi:hypothetical protein